MADRHTGRPRTGRIRRSARKASRRYFALVEAFPLRPIQSDAELDCAVKTMDRLFERKSLTDDEQAYMEVLGGLICAYEIELHPMAPVSPGEMLRFLIEQRGASLTDVSEATGVATSTLSSILGGKRRMNLDHMHALAPYFGVQAGVFVG